MNETFMLYMDFILYHWFIYATHHANV